MPGPGRMSPPASSEAKTAIVPVTRIRPVRTAALAARTVSLRGVAVRVRRIMPVPYSPLMALTARTATTAWPRESPGRLILAGASGQPPGGAEGGARGGGKDRGGGRRGGGEGGVAAGGRRGVPEQAGAGGAGRPGGEGEGAGDEGLGGRGRPPPGAGGEGGGDQAPPVLG